eukprot:TRINITY_DN21577_c0_g1_i1.p1 TRINITY_DN21577_c0_g1~~TRINITY_DN21577_c0_g1_i1.p1  ORF type:complete len:241 (+),score=51.15 TRINITY_DN21577_c0_g1_i1:151-873(+)
MKPRFEILLIIFSFIASSWANDVVIQHSFNSKPFTKRGVIKSKTLASDSPELVQSSPPVSDLFQLADDEGVYRVGIQTSNGLFVSSVPACAIIGSQFEDVITLTLDSTGTIVGASYSIKETSSSKLPDSRFPFCRQFVGGDRKTMKDALSNKAWMTTVITQPVLQAPVVIPNIIKPVNAIPTTPEEKEAQEKQQEERQSFLQKYWYYIVPAVVMLVINSVLAPAPQAAGPGQQRPQQRAQ